MVKALTIFTTANKVHSILQKNVNSTRYANAISISNTWSRNLVTEEHKEKQQSTSTDNSDITELDKKMETLSTEIKELKEKNSELLDKYKRSLADSENLRTRLNKQIEDAKVFGIQSFCKDLLEVADILSAATSAVPKEEVSDSNPHLKNLYEGLTMTNATLLQVFKRHGLEAVNPLNEKFNPNLHEALFQKLDTSVEPNIVVEVSKIGYKLRERVVRPALVGVSKSS